MLLATMLALAGCAGHDEPPRQKMAQALQEMSREVDRQVADPDRALRLQRTIAGLDGDLAELQGAADTLRVQLRTLNANPDASRADFVQLLDGFDARRARIRDRVLARHFELLAATTADEWAPLAPHERAALAAMSLR
jgi:hypothetical protein